MTLGGRISRAPDVLVYAVTFDRIPVSRFAIPPAQSRFEGRRVWSFVVSGIGLTVKIDNGPFNPEGEASRHQRARSSAGPVKLLNRDALAGMKAIAERMQVSRALS